MSNWSLILKKQPVDKRSLSATIQSDARTEKLLEQLKNQKPIKGFLGLLHLVKQGKLSAKDLYVINPRGTVTVEQAEANLQKLISFVNPVEPIEGQKLLDEGLKLVASRDEPTFSDQDKKRIAEIKTEVEKWYKSIKVKEGRSAKKAKLAASYRTFMRMAGNWVLKFNNIPEDAEEKRQFTENITEFAGTPAAEAEPREVIPLGTVVGDEIHTGFNNQREFMLALQNNGNLKEAYNELVRQYGPNLQGTQIGVKGNPDKAKLESMLAYGVNYEAVDITNINQINDYLAVVNSLEGKVGDLMPSTVKGSENLQGSRQLPISFFLRRGSAERMKRGVEENKPKAGKRKGGQNSLLLNPYANVLLGSSFSKSDWFSNFFKSVRLKESTKKAVIEDLIYSDIADLINGRGSEYGFDIKDFEGLTLPTSKSNQRQKIKGFLSKHTEVQKTVDIVMGTAQNNYLTATLQDALTKREKDKLEQGWETLSEAIEGWEGASKRKKNRLIDEQLGVLAFKGKGNGFYELYYQGEKRSPEDFLQIITGSDSLLDDDEAATIQNIMNMQEDEGEESPASANKLQSLRRYGSKDTNFEFFLLSLSKEELIKIVNERDDESATFITKLDPINSLIFFSKWSERLEEPYADRVKIDLLAIAEQDDLGKKAEIAEKLNADMPEILTAIRKASFSAFSVKLKDFAKNYVKYFPRNATKTIQAIEQFKEKGLLTGGN